MYNRDDYPNCTLLTINNAAHGFLAEFKDEVANNVVGFIKTLQL